MAANSATLSAPSASKALTIGLWVVQVLLALAFCAAGFTKVFTPFAELATPMPWTQAMPEALVRFIGLSELLGGIGLVLPSLTRIKPMLTPLAAAGLVLVMVLAAGFHASRGEWSGLPVNFTLGALAAFVAWGRSRKAPIAARV